jgi:putative membrane protein
MNKLLTNTVLSAAVTLGCLGLTCNAQAPGGGGGGGGGQQAPPQRPSSAQNQDVPGANNPNTMTARPMDDKKFVKEAAMGGLAEVELGKLAAQKGSSDAVKQFGQKMVDDHSKANDQLKEIATKQQIEVPTALDAKHQKRVDKLSGLSGEKFDTEYSKNMLKDHRKDVNDFQMAAQYGTDPNIKQFAASTLPVLQEHLKMAEDLNKKK